MNAEPVKTAQTDSSKESCIHDARARKRKQQSPAWPNCAETKTAWQARCLENTHPQASASSHMCPEPFKDGKTYLHADPGETGIHDTGLYTSAKSPIGFMSETSLGFPTGFFAESEVDDCGGGLRSVMRISAGVLGTVTCSGVLQSLG